MDNYELSKPHKHGTKENITHLTGKHAKSKAIEKSIGRHKLKEALKTYEHHKKHGYYKPLSDKRKNGPPSEMYLKY